MSNSSFDLGCDSFKVVNLTNKLSQYTSSIKLFYFLSHLFKLYIYELIQISNTKIMDNQKYKLEKLKNEQKAKSSRDELFNSYLDKTTKVEDKITLD